jgi:isopenicillin-N epimerase
VLERLRAQLLLHQTSLVVMCSITSNTALKLPVADIAMLCEQQGDVPLLIDAAHDMMAVDRSFKDLTAVGPSATLVITNAHKWLSAPKGAAFLYVCRSAQLRR